MSSWIDRLAQVECPAFTARRARRGEQAGAREDPLVWVRAQDEFVWDASGKRYIDMTAGFGVMTLGHNHPAVRAALESQLGSLWHALGDVHPSDKKIELMERLCEISPYDDARVILGLSGSDAVDGALKTAQVVTEKPGVIAFEGGYHGLASGPLAVNGYRSAMREPFTQTLNPHVDFVPFATNNEQLESLLAQLQRLDTSSVGALIVEPIQGRGGIVVPAAGLLKALRTFCDEREILLICDEVLTGFGRAGALWASDNAGVRPDLLCVGKALGGGLPVSACIGPLDLMQHWGAPTSEALHTGTFFGNPLSCASALGFLNAWYESNALHSANTQGARLRSTLEALGRGTVRGAAMMLALDLGIPGAGLAMMQRLREGGVLVLPNGPDASGIQLTPPLNLSNEAINTFATVLERALDQETRGSLASPPQDRRSALQSRIEALIVRLADGSRDDAARDALIEEIFAWQSERVPALGAWATVMEGAALPTEAFRTSRVASFDETEETGRFMTSGTTNEARGVHPHRDLSLYDLSAKSAAKFALFPDCETIDLLIVAPRSAEVPTSSLFYMFDRFADWFGARCAWFVREDEIDVAALQQALERAQNQGRPVALLGTSLAFVRLEKAFAGNFSLPAGSRLMHTGGFKGQRIEIEPDVLRARLAARYGLDEAFVVREYGMTEMSSQLYEWSLRDALENRPIRNSYWIPGWVRVTEVSPATLLASQPLDGRAVLRIDDLANLDSCVALQTLDCGEVAGNCLTLEGRIQTAPARGCSLTAEQWKTCLAGGKASLSGDGP